MLWNFHHFLVLFLFVLDCSLSWTKAHCASWPRTKWSLSSIPSWDPSLSRWLTAAPQTPVSRRPSRHRCRWSPSWPTRTTGRTSPAIRPSTASRNTGSLSSLWSLSLIFVYLLDKKCSLCSFAGVPNLHKILFSVSLYFCFSLFKNITDWNKNPKEYKFFQDQNSTKYNFLCK